MCNPHEIIILAICLFTSASLSQATERVIHVFVALCDNATQGIAPVGAAIGDGDKPDANLYWGCSDGTQRYFAKSKLWRKIETHRPQSIDASSPIMRRIVFKHNLTGALLIADAYQGKHIRQCITDYLNASSGSYIAEVNVKNLKRKISIGAAANLTTYIGHNGLMEFEITPTSAKESKPKDTITLCCVSESYFRKHFAGTTTTPILQTRSLMYPGAFILHDALEGWFKGETRAQIRTRAAKAYAKNQKISLKGGLSIFKNLEDK